MGVKPDQRNEYTRQVQDQIYVWQGNLQAPEGGARPETVMDKHNPLDAVPALQPPIFRVRCVRRRCHEKTS